MCKTSPYVLDLGVGRGGDMHKWHKANIQKVVGIDISREYIEEAIRRYKQCKYLWVRDYKFYYTSPEQMFSPFLNKRGIECNATFDIVSCMFAFHYFFQDEYSLHWIMKQIADVLVPGGYFIGTCPNGDNIHEAMGKNDELKNDAIYIKRLHTQSDVEHGCGCKIQFMLSGTLYFGEKMLSEEYLVFERTLRSSAEKHGLKCISLQGFDKFYSDQHRMDDLTKQASFLNMAFVFQKNQPANP